jgi:hypothetical protein
MERPQHSYNHGQQWTKLHVNIGDVTTLLLQAVHYEKPFCGLEVV